MPASPSAGRLSVKCGLRCHSCHFFVYCSTPCRSEELYCHLLRLACHLLVVSEDSSSSTATTPKEGLEDSSEGGAGGSSRGGSPGGLSLSATAAASSSATSTPSASPLKAPAGYTAGRPPRLALGRSPAGAVTLLPGSVGGSGGSGGGGGGGAPLGVPSSFGGLPEVLEHLARAPTPSSRLDLLMVLLKRLVPGGEGSGFIGLAGGGARHEGLEVTGFRVERLGRKGRDVGRWRFRGSCG